MIINKKIFLALCMVLQLVFGYKIVAQETESLVSFADGFDIQAGIESKSIKNIFLLNDSLGVRNFVINYSSEGGYKLVVFENGHYQITGFSDKGTFSMIDNPFFSNKKISFKELEFSEILRKTSDTEKPAKSKNELKADVDNFVTSVWGSVNCFDNTGTSVFTTNYYTPSHCSAGCVAISGSQILNYYKWPIVGMGNNNYTDSFNGINIIHTEFMDRPFDWKNSKDLYYYAATTDVERQACGRIAKTLGVGLLMDYEPTGSTNNVANMPAVLAEYYRYTSHYELPIWSSFWSRIYDNIQNGLPVQLAISATATGDGHAVVLSGYRYISGVPYYYVNWSWYNVGTQNGWYNIQGWTSASVGYNTITGALLDIVPEPQVTTVSKSEHGNDITVFWEVSPKLKWEEFTLQQKVDGGIWTDVAVGIMSKHYTISNPTGKVYQFRVEAKVNGGYYLNSWSEPYVYAVTGGYNGIGVFGGNQGSYAYIKQTQNNDLNFSADYCMETWLRVKSNNETGDIIFDQQGSFSLYISDVTVSDYSVTFKNLSNSSTLVSSSMGSKLLVNQWNHIAVTKTANITTMYINGVKYAEDSSNAFGLTLSVSALNIGERYVSGYNSYIIADFDQIRFSNIGRYSNNFSPTLKEQFTVDANTIGYLTFQNIHSTRLKDDAFIISTKVIPGAGYLDWNYELSDVQLSVNEIKEFSKFIQVYPNPVVNGNLNIKVTSTKNYQSSDFEYRIFDITGKLVQKGNLDEANNGTQTIQISKLTKGIFTIQISNQEIRANKIIIND
jgi:hypothetical protein